MDFTPIAMSIISSSISPRYGQFRFGFVDFEAIDAAFFFCHGESARYSLFDMLLCCYICAAAR